MGMHRVALRVLFAVLVGALASRPSAADEWSPTRPKAMPSGSPITLKRNVTDATKLPRARVVTKHHHAWADRSAETAVEFDAVAAPAKPDAKGRPQVAATLTVTGLAVENLDLMGRVAERGAEVTVLSTLDAHGYVGSATATGGVAEGALGDVFRPTGAWLLPYLPEKPVRVGDVWDLPIPYFLWSIKQQGDAPATGFVTQTLLAVELHGGVKCARLKTVASVRRPQPAGMTPKEVGVGDGAALTRIRAEGTTWVDLDGCVREDVLDVTLRVENDETKAWMEWTFHRDLKAQPVGAPPPPKDWSAHVGNVKFVEGFEKGLDKAWNAGKPAMLFFTSIKDHWGPIFGARTWKDKEVLERVKGYVPVLVDADERGDLRKRYDVVVLPAVVWVDSDGNHLFAAMGDAPIELFRTAAATAQERVPDGPAPSFLAARKAGEELRAALKAWDVRAAMRAIHDIDELKRPASLVEEARAAEAQIEKRGAGELAKAKALLEAGKKPEATEALEQVRKAYGDHPVGREAKELLRSLVEPEK